MFGHLKAAEKTHPQTKCVVYLRLSFPFKEMSYFNFIPVELEATELSNKLG